MPTPALFGQKYSSRDYSKERYWGKNQFNSSFPASLVAYMHSLKIAPVYLKTNKQNDLVKTYILADQLFGIDPLSDSAYYNFEAGFSPYEKFYTGAREKIDLVMLNRQTNQSLVGLEIKLTALPDNTTKNLSEDAYGCEIVMRAPTISFLACSICAAYEKKKDQLANLIRGVGKVAHWEDADEVAVHYQEIEDALMRVSKDMSAQQVPLIVQPVWKTLGSKLKLADDCLDVFVWSNLSILQMCVRSKSKDHNPVNRFHRTMVWVYKMLFDYVAYGVFDPVTIIKNHSYGNANDKAFALSGSVSHGFLKSPELTHPRIPKSAIRHIILGGGQNLLSPERRFDAAIVASPELFQ